MSGKLFIMGDETHGLTVAVTDPPLVAHIPAAHFSYNATEAKEQFSKLFSMLLAAIEGDKVPGSEQGLGGGLFDYLDGLQRNILKIDDPLQSKEGPSTSTHLTQSGHFSAILENGGTVNNVGNCVVFDMPKLVGSVRGKREEIEQPVDLLVYLSNMSKSS